ncbi:MAG: hypothetical protein MUF86_10285 [Akkermansiaceae bacterium]|jgi:hypothetical protein|nr:hypothetical protein [Akkermansiaceae bacterium]
MSPDRTGFAAPCRDGTVRSGQSLVISGKINLIGQPLAHFRKLNTLRRIPFLKDWREVPHYFSYLIARSIARTQTFHEFTEITPLVLLPRTLCRAVDSSCGGFSRR